MPETGPIGSANLFIRRWGEMAASWGISRTMAEIHALLYLAPEPLCTDDVMDRLEVSRGSASMNLRALENWGLIYRNHRRGDRKEYFEAEKDVWIMFETITRERRRREVQPIVETLERCVEMLGDDGKVKKKGEEKDMAGVYRERFEGILDFVELMNGVLNVVSKLGKRSSVQMLTKQLAKMAG